MARMFDEGPGEKGKKGKKTRTRTTKQSIHLPVDRKPGIPTGTPGPAGPVKPEPTYPIASWPKDEDPYVGQEYNKTGIKGNRTKVPASSLRGFGGRGLRRSNPDITEVDMYSGRPGTSRYIRASSGRVYRVYKNGRKEYIGRKAPEGVDVLDVKTTNEKNRREWRKKGWLKD